MKNFKKVVIAFLMTFTISCLPIFSVLAVDWVCYQKDESRNGYSSENIFLPMKMDFEINVGEELSGGILVNGNDFFFTTKKGTIGSGNGFTGKINWKRNLNEEIESCATLSQYDIFVATKKGNVYCIGQKTGVILWHINLEKPISSPLLRSFRFLYLSLDEGKVICINNLDGTIIWSTDLGQEIRTGLTYKNNALFAVTVKGQLASIDSQSGKILWTYHTGFPTQCPPITGSEAIYFGDNTGSLFCFDYLSAKQYWTTKFNSAFVSAMTFAYFDKRVLCGGLQDRYIGIASGTGKEMWSYKSDRTSVAPVSAGRLIFLQGPNQTLAVLDSFDGKEAFSIPLNANISAGMAIANGRILLGTDKGRIMILASSLYDYQIELKPDIQTVTPGTSTKFEVLIKTSPNYSDSISFAVQGFPCSCKGVSRYFDQTTIIPPRNVTLIIDVGPEAEEARYNITVVSYSGKDLRREANGVLDIRGKKEGTTLAVVKPSEPVLSGQDFVVDVNLSEAANVRSVSFLMEYPKDMLYVRDVSMGNFYKGEQKNLVFDKIISNENGLLTVGVGRKDVGDSGNGSIARIVFKSLKAGVINLKIIKFSVRDTFLWEISVKPVDLELTILQGIQKKIVMTINKKVMLINDQSFPLESPPVLENGRTLVPILIIAENLESTVTWDAKEQKITILHFNKRIEMWINKATCFVNGLEKTMPSNVPPRLLFNRTYVPLKFVADELDASVSWDAKKQQITILYPAK